MNTQTKIALGSVSAIFGALTIVLSILLEWTAVPRPWGFLLGFVLGVVTGIGAALAISGLIDIRRGIS